MNAIRLSRRALGAALVVLSLTACAPAHEYFLDGFEDGNVEDGEPVTWVHGSTPWGPFPGGTHEVVDGSWIWTQDQTHIGIQADEYIYEDVSVHTQFRMGSSSSSVNICVCDTQYAARVNASGDAALLSPGKWWYRYHGAGLRPQSNDVHMQVDKFDDELSVTYWNDGDPKPPLPQKMINIPDTCEGHVGIFFNLWQDNATATYEFRFFEATPLTESPLPQVELIGAAEDWSFFPGTEEPSLFPELAWTTVEFDDSQWDIDQEGFGFLSEFEDPEMAEAREIVTFLDDMQDNYGSLYLRHPFKVDDPLGFSHLLLQIDYDDSFIAYINGEEVVRSNLGTPESPVTFDARGRSRGELGISSFFIDLESFPELIRAGDENVLAIQGINSRSSDRDFVLSQIRLSGVIQPLPAQELRAGDADQDYDFDQLDLVKVLVAAKYLTGEPATWGEGDWNGAPGGSPGDPPPGNGLFDQVDIIAALGNGVYLSGPYPAVQPNGQQADAQTSVVYNAATGELAVDAPAQAELTSINIDSASGIFTGQPTANLGGSFDNDSDNNIFKATFGSSFGSLSFGNGAQTGLSEDFVAGDLTVIGSLQGGGGLGDVDLVYIPEPSGLVLVILGLLGLMAAARLR